MWQSSWVVLYKYCTLQTTKTTGSCDDPNELSPLPHILSFKIHFNVFRGVCIVARISCYDFKLSPCSLCSMFNFWVFPRRLRFKSRRFGTLYRFHLPRQVKKEPYYNLLLVSSCPTVCLSAYIRTAPPLDEFLSKFDTGGLV